MWRAAAVSIQALVGVCVAGTTSFVLFFLLAMPTCHPSHLLPWGSPIPLLVGAASALLSVRSDHPYTRAFSGAASATFLAAAALLLWAALAETGVRCKSMPLFG